MNSVIIIFFLIVQRQEIDVINIDFTQDKFEWYSEKAINFNKQHKFGNIRYLRSA